MKKSWVVSFLMLCIMTFVFGDEFSDKIDLQESNLRGLREKLTEATKKAKELEQSEKNVLEKVSRVDEELVLTQKLLKALKDKEKIISDEIDKTENVINMLEKQRKERSKILNKRLRSIYKKGKMNTMEILLTSKSFTDVLKRFEYLTIIAEQDKRVFNELLVLKNELDEKKRFLRTNLDEIRKVNIEGEKETVFLQETRKQKQSMLESIQKEREKQEELAKELGISARKIQNLIVKLEKERKEREKIEGAKNYFEKVVGKIKWPVKGNIMSTFGEKVNPKYGTTVKNNGIDIKAARGSYVHSIAKGKVAYNDRFLGYGNVILIDHGKGYYSLYAHLEDINVKVNDVIEKDQVIGTVGDTGSLEGSKLHFEIRKNGKPIDPIPFLKQNK